MSTSRGSFHASARWENLNLLATLLQSGGCRVVISDAYRLADPGRRAHMLRPPRCRKAGDHPYSGLPACPLRSAKLDASSQPAQDRLRRLRDSEHGVAIGYLPQLLERRVG
jgi:hypothetical protein